VAQRRRPADRRCGWIVRSPAIGSTPDEIMSVLRLHEARRDSGLRVSLLPEALETVLAAARRQRTRERCDAATQAERNARASAEDAIALINPRWASLRQRMVDLFVQSGGDCTGRDALGARSTDLAAIAERARSEGLAALEASRAVADLARPAGPTGSRPLVGPPG